MQTPYFHPRREHNYKFDRFNRQPQPPHFPKQPFNQYRGTNNQHNEEHWCETCDRSFYSLDLLEQHKQQHQKCNIDGCQFIAHPKVITKHIQMQHSSGLFKKIAKLNNPEEIQKWREERKKRYPTKVNIDKKAAETKEKIERGEKMGLKRDGFNRQHKRDEALQKRNSFQNEKSQLHRNGQKLKVNSLNFKKTKKTVVPKKTHEIPDADSLRKLKPFAGIQDIIMEDSSTEVDLEHTNCDFIIEDDDCEGLSKPMQHGDKNNTEPIVCGALSSLISNYDSSDDEVVNSENIIEPLQKNMPQKSNLAKNKPIIADNLEIVKEFTATNKEENKNYCNKSDDDSGPEETKIDKKDELPRSEELPKSEEQNKTKKKGAYIDNKPKRNNNFKRPKHKVPSTLLQKLLRREVQQERNIVLQCIRHIVKNNFFDKK